MHPGRFAIALAAGVLVLSNSNCPSLHAQSGPGQAASESVLEGNLEVLYEDWNGGSRLNHFLRTADGRRVRLQFPPAGRSSLLTGTRVRARGRLSNGTLMLDSAASITQLSLASAYTFGPQSTIVILVNFRDNPVQPYTVVSASDVTFGQTSSFYSENSYHQTAVVGDVFGWFTIAWSSMSCDAGTVAALAEQAATAAGADLSRYTRRIYAFPSTSACGWWGLGTVGGGDSSRNPSRAWINGTYSVRVVAHEFGHNLGDFHSHASACSSSGCTINEYGDDHDTMGSVTGHMNAFQKERLGWLNHGSSPPIKTVTETGQHWLEPYETASGGFPKALKVPLASTSSSNSYLYIEARTRTGWDASLAPGVLVHTGTDTDGNSSVQTDLDPVSTTTDLMLDPGQSVIYSNGLQPITIATLSSDDSGALIDVNFGPLTSQLLVAAASDKSTYKIPPATSVRLSATVTIDGQPAPGVVVTFTIARPLDGTATISATTNGSGVATASYKITRSFPKGTYTVLAVATYRGMSASDDFTFVTQ